jgi:hypothetical protein
LLNPNNPTGKAFDDETMQHFQALVRFNTMDPPGNKKPAAMLLGPDPDPVVFKNSISLR